MKNPVFIQSGDGATVTTTLSGLNHDQRRLTQRRLRRKQRRTEVVRTVSLEDIPSGSLMSEASLEAIRAGKWTFAKEIPKPTPSLSAKERARIGRMDRLTKVSIDEATALSCPVPWLPLITPISQDELDRMRVAKRAARKARRNGSGKR